MYYAAAFQSPIDFSSLPIEQGQGVDLPHNAVKCHVAIVRLNEAKNI